MKYEQKIYISIMWVILGAALAICGSAGIIGDDMWTGLGYGWLACGAVQLIRQMRYRHDENYREKFDIAVKDERNKYIATKAWAWAGYGYVLVSAAAVIVMTVMGHNEFVQIICGGVCLIVCLYWISYMFLKKKY